MIGKLLGTEGIILLALFGTLFFGEDSLPSWARRAIAWAVAADFFVGLLTLIWGVWS